MRRWGASALHPRDVRTTSLDTERVLEEDVHMSEISPSAFHIPVQIPLTVTLKDRTLLKHCRHGSVNKYSR